MATTPPPAPHPNYFLELRQPVFVTEALISDAMKKKGAWVFAIDVDIKIKSVLFDKDVACWKPAMGIGVALPNSEELLINVKMRDLP